VHDELISEPYRLVAVDVLEDMSVCRTYQNACVGDGLPGPAVFQAGWNTKYIVAARYPHYPHRIDPQYFYIERTETEKDATTHVNVVGPFNADEFARKKLLLGQPEFTTRIRRLM
jgi:hypothetical protein